MVILYRRERKLSLHILFQLSQHLPLFCPAALFTPSNRLSEAYLRVWLRVSPNRALCRSHFCEPNDFHSPAANRVSKGRFLTAVINHSLIYKANKSRCRYSWLSLVQSTGVFASCVCCHGATVLQRIRPGVTEKAPQATGQLKRRRRRGWMSWAAEDLSIRRKGGWSPELGLAGSPATLQMWPPTQSILSL